MRVYIREKFRDIRMNTNVGRALWKFVEHAQANPEATHLLDNVDSPIPPPAKRGRKRKGDDSDGEYRPAPVRNIGSAPRTRGRRTN
jgi:hypothetical protein